VSDRLTDKQLEEWAEYPGTEARSIASVIVMARELLLARKVVEAVKEGCVPYCHELQLAGAKGEHADICIVKHTLAAYQQEGSNA